jgi:hypothetical protein
MTTRISRPCHHPPPKLSVLCVSAPLRDNRFPSFLPFSFSLFRQESPSNNTLPNPFKLQHLQTISQVLIPNNLQHT